MISTSIRRPSGVRSGWRPALARCRSSVAVALAVPALPVFLVMTAGPAAAVVREPVRPVSTAAWVLTLVYFGIAVSAAIWLVAFVRRGRW
ncbi:MAG: hypothetical protein M3P91_07240 [Actinomycetota bacterium]|nr:hypothetical protein [Actinomycetota bacterium]